MAARLWVMPQSPSPAALSKAFRCSSSPIRVVHTRSSTSVICFAAPPRKGGQYAEALLDLLTANLDQCGRYGCRGPCMPHHIPFGAQAKVLTTRTLGCPSTGPSTSCCSGLRGLWRLFGSFSDPLPPSHRHLGRVRPGCCSSFSI